MILVDEVDKIKDYYDPHPENKLLTLLERHTARSFEDEFLRVPMRGDNIVWIFTANDVSHLSSPFLDRVVILRIPDLSWDARDAVFERMLGEVAGELGLVVTLESRAALKPVHALGLRRAKLAFELAVARVAAQGHRVIGPDDLAAAAKHLRKRRTARAKPKDQKRLRGPVGFIDPRRQRERISKHTAEGEEEM